MEFHAPVMPSAILNVVTPPRAPVSPPPFKLNRHRLGFESPDPFADKEPPITTSGFASDASMSSFIVELSIFIFEAFIWIVELLAADISPAIEIFLRAASHSFPAMFFMSGGDVAKLFLFGICALNYCGIKTEASFNRKIVFLHKLYLDF